MIGLESIIIGFAPRSSVENVILCVCWQLGCTVEVHTRSLILWQIPLHSCSSLYLSHPQPLLFPFFFIRFSKTHFNWHSGESSRLVTQVQVLIALWCNVIRPLMARPQTPFCPLHRADESKEVSNCFWLSRVPHPKYVEISQTHSEHSLFNEIASCLCRRDNRGLMALAFYQSILNVSMLRGLWEQPVFHLDEKIGPYSFKEKSSS